MQVLKKVSTVLASMLLILCLPLVAFLFVNRSTIMDKVQVKSWFAASGAYENIINNLGTTFEKSVPESTVQSITDSEPSVSIEVATKALQAAFPSGVLEQHTETIIDATYDWLEGKSPRLVFSIDLADAKQRFLDSLAAQARERVATLPVCTTEQLQTIPADIDVFKISCVPAGISIESEINNYVAKTANSKDFFSKTTLSADDIKVNNNGTIQSINEALANASTAYNAVKNSLWVIIFLCAFLSGIIMWLSWPKPTGYKILAWIYGVAGLWQLLITVPLVAFSNSDTSKVNVTGNGEEIARNIILPFIKEVLRSYTKWMFIIGIIYVVIAAICVLLFRRTKKQVPPDYQNAELQPQLHAPLTHEPQQVDNA